MEEFVDWIIYNKQWLFSGAGLMVLAWIGRIVFKKKYASSTQTIRSGDRSTNVQAGRDVSIGREKTENDAEN
ncbi:hypothetical protein [Marinimicrobium sp. C2-29]|uniref:hypothetical protein n=1 Tax=Marinimicrobium sp. C2-29 TaxID=3139825 RepID=UPI003139AAAA